MKIGVVGSGVIGTTTAYYLARAGHQVIVLDRQPAAGLETSFANAGQISPGYASPWAAPGIPLKALKWMLQRHAPLVMHLDGSWHQLQWLWQFWRQCNLDRYEINKERMVRLAEYSRDCLDQLREESGISYEGRQLGTLQVFRTRRQFEAASKDIAVLAQAGVPYELLTADQLGTAEPALAHVSQLTGGLRLPHDETGDCYLFTSRLAEKAVEMGVDFRFQSHVVTLILQGAHIAQVVCADGSELKADVYVMAAGSYSPGLLKDIINIPVYPVKGYSITLPLLDDGHAPQSTILDETYKVAITRFDQRIRVGGMAELAGYDLHLDLRRRKTLEMVVRDLFSVGVGTEPEHFWCGLRPMTPDGTPIVGPTPLENLFLNTGHGTLGWTMACGSASLLADLICGKVPAIRHEDLAMRRYG